MEEISAPICLLVVIGTAIFSFRAFSRPYLIERFLFDIEGILKYKQYYRIVTGALLHGSMPHLLFNMFSLFSFGSAIEEVCGPLQFLVIYLAGIVGGSLLALIVHRKHQYRALGASGGVCGVIFACIFLLPGISVQMFFVPIDIPSHVFAVLFIIFSFLALRGQIGNIGHDAHLGGAIIGLLTATAMYPWIIKEQPELYAGVMALSCGGLLWLYVSPLYLKKERFKPINFSRSEQPKTQTEPKAKSESKSEQKDEDILNSLLQKVSEKGIHSLTYIERQKLERISKKRKAQQQ